MDFNMKVPQEFSEVFKGNSSLNNGCLREQ